MSDMGITPGDQTVDLDLTGVDAIHGWIPVPTGIYVLQVDDAKIVPTKDERNKQIEFRLKIVEGDLSGRSIGVERVFLPNRNTQDEKSWKTTAGYFKGKIEAVTAKPYGGSFNVRELIGMKFKAVVVLEDKGFGPSNSVNAYMPLSADTSGLVLPQAAPRPPQNGGHTGNGDDTAAGGRFRI